MNKFPILQSQEASSTTPLLPEPVFYCNSPGSLDGWLVANNETVGVEFHIRIHRELLLRFAIPPPSPPRPAPAPLESLATCARAASENEEARV